MTYRRYDGFTLVELLVVISIIVILLALLVPALDKALKSADKAKCLSNQHQVAQACQIYALESNRIFPAANIGPYDPGLGVVPPPAPSIDDVVGSLPIGLPSLPPPPPLPAPPPIVSGNPYQYAMDVKASNYPDQPLGVGLLVNRDLLPKTRLGNVVHCPSLETGSSDIPGFGMDEIHAAGAGASWYEDPDQIGVRKISGYHYRGASYARVNNGAPIRMAQAAGFVVYVDMLDPRYGIRNHHENGYNRAFGDGSSEFFSDGSFVIDNYITGPGGNAEIDGIQNPNIDEEIFRLLSRNL